MQIGQRVKVTIQNYSAYAVGAAESLDGKTGEIAEVKENGRVLVRFDTPAERWWTHQTPATSFWFDCDEVKTS